MVGNGLNKDSLVLKKKKNSRQACARYYLRKKRNNIKALIRGDKILNKKDVEILKELGVCEVCGWDKARCDLHHIVPIKDGGSDSESNLILLCPNCHRLEHIKLRKEKQQKLKKENKCYFCESDKDLRYMGAKIWICVDKKKCQKRCREFVKDEIERFNQG